MRRVNAGAAGALEVAVARNRDDLLRYLVARTEQPEDAADAFGEAMVAAWRNVRSLPADPTEARMWLFVVARNALRNVDRGRRRRNDAVRELGAVLTVTDRAAPADLDARLDVRRAIDELPSHLGELLRLVHWDGFTLAEAAVLLDTPAATIRGQHVRAKELLRAALSAHPAPGPSTRHPSTSA